MAKALLFIGVRCNDECFAPQINGLKHWGNKL